MNNRRKLAIALGAGALAAPFGLFAQQPAPRKYRIGFLGPTSAAGIERRLEGLRVGLRELGYVEGKNLVIEFRWAEGKYDRLPALAAELVRLNVELIVTYATQGSLAAKNSTATIPIVMATVGDVIAAGLVASLARPDGNITGSTVFSSELSAKRLELLKEAFPRTKRVAVLTNLANEVFNGPILQAMTATAKSLKMDLQVFGVRSPNEFDSTFAAMSTQRVEAVAITDDVMVIANADAVASLAVKHRLASIGGSEVAEAGCLITYGVNFPALFRRAAVFVDKILKGAKPRDIPVEQATTFELVINLKTAKALGIKIPQTLMQRADKVIE
jgi:putative ABC transport system substrate-binding protein